MNGSAAVDVGQIVFYCDSELGFLGWTEGRLAVLEAAFVVESDWVTEEQTCQVWLDFVGTAALQELHALKDPRP